LYFLIAGAFAVMAVSRPKRAPYFNAIAILAIKLAIGTAVLFAVIFGCCCFFSDVAHWPEPSRPGCNQDLL
jgi:hypothetical protein